MPLLQSYHALDVITSGAPAVASSQALAAVLFPKPSVAQTKVRERGDRHCSSRDSLRSCTITPQSTAVRVATPAGIAAVRPVTGSHDSSSGCLADLSCEERGT